MEYGQVVFEMASIIIVSLLRLRDKREKREMILNTDLESLTIALNKPVIFFTALTIGHSDVDKKNKPRFLKSASYRAAVISDKLFVN